MRRLSWSFGLSGLLVRRRQISLLPLQYFGCAPSGPHCVESFHFKLQLFRCGKPSLSHLPACTPASHIWAWFIPHNSSTLATLLAGPAAQKCIFSLGTPAFVQLRLESCKKEAAPQYMYCPEAP